MGFNENDWNTETDTNKSDWGVNTEPSPNPFVQKSPTHQLGMPTNNLNQHPSMQQTPHVKDTSEQSGYTQEQMEVIRKKYKLLGATPIWAKIIMWILFFPCCALALGSGACLAYTCINISANLHQIEMSASIGLFISILVVFIMIVLFFLTKNNWKKKVNAYKRKLKQRKNEMLSNVEITDDNFGGMNNGQTNSQTSAYPRF